MNRTQYLKLLNNLSTLKDGYNIKQISYGKNKIISARFRYGENDIKYAKIFISDEFPLIPPKVWLFDDIRLEKISDFQWTTHKNSDDSICLFTGSLSDNSWRYQDSIFKIFLKIEAFLTQCLSNTISDDHSTIFYPVPGRPQDPVVFMFYEDFHEAKKNSENELFLYSFLDNRPAFLLTLKKNKNDFDVIKEKYGWIINPYYQKAYIVFLNTNILDFRRNLKGEINFEKIVSEYLEENINLSNYDYFAFFFKDSVISDELIIKTSQFNPLLSYLYDLKGKKFENINKIPHFKIIGFNPTYDLYQRTYGVLEKMIDSIEEKSLLIIGLGSMGSTIALELAKSGFRKFSLVDPDILNPVNVCRHIGFLSDIGKHKVEIVREQIMQKNPYADVVPYPNDLFLNKNLPILAHLIKESDIIIDTTAVESVGMLINKFALELNKVAIYCYCYRNAILGRIFKVIPKRTPCYSCVQQSLMKDEGYFSSLGKNSSEDDDLNGNVYFEGYSEPGIPGISIDINFVNLFVCKFIIETLKKELHQIPMLKADHYLWQNSPTKYGNEQVGFIPIGDEIQKDRNCKFCGSSLKLQNSGKHRKTEQKIQKLEKKLK
ncbi:ThiF family adenylyltransferase [Promethearchaeum syntrophicum]|uniref:ThiF family adenylyltransferase n=1 Tax=Promethearchaeum syntrophicum TaxID=2594042 RepID=A0A5B9D8B9_9ARCH|nr:ThiF family adenylyltransferase [Candidatus Prometheoarchaeum syntrophicum]QEE15275.1 thiamine biosynthesis protein ThiF [Candidatus Prometheoarchaeum syntrophicum]